jgi:2-dehydropantoate 2-reductase
MRYVVVGVGAIGGVIAGRLHQSGREVLGVARGEHYAAIAKAGLSLTSPTGTAVLDLPVANGVGDVTFRADDAVIVAVKGQDTQAVIRQMGAVAPPTVRIVSAQNGVDNERTSLRVFAHVYGMCVMCPATYLTAGSVEVFCAPTSGVLDVGGYPTGADEFAAALSADLVAATFHSVVSEDVMTLKWGKLMSNINNAIEALCGPGTRGSQLSERVSAEAVAVLAAHGVDADAAQAALRERMANVEYRPVGGAGRGGGSSWQSLERGVGEIESDYLNGEIVLLGRLVGVPAPANELLQRRANQAAHARLRPGSVSEATLLAELDEHARH